MVYLYELQAAQIDRDLEDTADQIGRVTGREQPGDLGAAGAPGAGGFDATGEFGPGVAAPQDQSMLQQQSAEDPDLPPLAGEEDAERDERMAKKVDAGVITAVQNMPYVKDYRHQESSRVHPYHILQMPVDELNQLRNMVRNKINMDAFADRVGVYDSPDARFYQDLLSYVDKALTSQRSALKGYNDNKQGKSAKFDKREQSKNSEAKEFAPKK